MSKVRSVIKLYAQGVSKLSIGERTRLPRNTVKRYIQLFLASGLSLEDIDKLDDKALEGAVKIIYRTIYPEVKKQIYAGLDSLNRAIQIALEAHNNRLFNGRPYSRRQLFEDIERDQLQGLPQTRFEIKRRKVMTVMKNN